MKEVQEEGAEVISMNNAHAHIYSQTTNTNQLLLPIELSMTIKYLHGSPHRSITRLQNWQCSYLIRKGDSDRDKINRHEGQRQ